MVERWCERGLSRVERVVCSSRTTTSYLPMDLTQTCPYPYSVEPTSDVHGRTESRGEGAGWYGLVVGYGSERGEGGGRRRTHLGSRVA